MSYILLAGNHPEKIKKAAKILRRNRIPIRTARDGRGVLENVREELPIILFMDVFMPYVDGYEIMEYIQQRYAERNIGLIIADCISADGDIRVGWEYPVSAYVAMPYHEWHIVLSVEQLLYRAVSEDEKAVERWIELDVFGIYERRRQAQSEPVSSEEIIETYPENDKRETMLHKLGKWIQRKAAR